MSRNKKGVRVQAMGVPGKGIPGRRTSMGKGSEVGVSPASLRTGARPHGCKWAGGGRDPAGPVTTTETFVLK